MPFGSHPVRSVRILSLLLLIICAISLSAPDAEAQFTEMIVTVGDTTGPAGQQNSVVTVFLDNFDDTVSAFTVWVRLNRPDIAKFQTEFDTVVDTTYWTCLVGEYPNCDSAVSWDTTSAEPQPDYFLVDTVEAFVGNVDTAGTLISGWEYVDSRNIDGDGNDVRVTGVANQLGGPNTPGIPPQTGGVLFRLRADILNVDDTLQDRTAILDVITGAKQFFVFSRPDGTSIGYVDQTRPDTNYYRCTWWDLGECLEWTKVAFAPYDSVEYTEVTYPVLDTNLVIVDRGSITALSGVCGNVNDDSGGDVDISDLTMLVNHLFVTNQPLPNPELADVTCDGSVDISDLTAIVNFLFVNNQPLCQPPLGQC